MQNKYLAIYEDLVQEIKVGNLAVNSLLPSENELTAQYNTSRETIRKALNMLSQNGFIQKIRGKGSIVLDIHKFSFPVSGIVSYQELSEQLQLPSKTHVKHISYLPTSHKVVEKLITNQQDKVWTVNRVREIAGEKIILDKDYFNSKYVPLLPKEICEKSIYHYIEKELGLVIGFAQKEIIVDQPTPEDREFLDLEGFHNVVVIRSHVYLEDTSLFQYTESRHRPDKFRFVDFARRVNH